MPLNIYKPIDNQEWISILIPTRNRPNYLEKIFISLEETTEDKQLLDLWLYVDNDDIATKEFMETQGKKYSFAINCWIGSRTTTQGEMYNILRKECTRNPGIYMMGGDKMLFLTPNWDRVVRDRFNSYQDRILFAYPSVPLSLDFGIFGFISAEWTNKLGKFFTEYFPFWYDDLWINQVGLMIDRKIELKGMKLDLQGGKGKTIRMHNLLFWEKLFNNTLDERIEEANILRGKIYSEGDPDFDKKKSEVEEIIQGFIQESQSRGDDGLIYMENSLRHPDASKYSKDKLYLIAEKSATKYLYRKMLQMISQGKLMNALNILENISYGYSQIKEIQYKRIYYQARLRYILNRFQG